MRRLLQLMNMATPRSVFRDHVLTGVDVGLDAQTEPFKLSDDHHSPHLTLHPLISEKSAGRRMQVQLKPVASTFPLM